MRTPELELEEDYFDFLVDVMISSVWVDSGESKRRVNYCSLSQLNFGI